MDRKELFHCLVFDDDAAPDQHVQAVTGFDIDASIADRERDLALHLHPGFLQLELQAALIG